jgi:hypothetical protein
MAKVQSPFPLFVDVDGDPLESGFIYVGQAGLNPEVTPITLYSDKDLTVPIAQPVRTLGGLPVVSGSPVQLYVSEVNYSILVRNKNGTLVRSALNSSDSLVVSNILQFQTVIDLIARSPNNATALTDDQMAALADINALVSTVWNNTASEAGGADYVITDVNPGDLSSLVGGAWIGSNHDLGGGYYAKLDVTGITDIAMLGGSVADGADLGAVIGQMVGSSIKEIYISNSTWTATGSVDGQGLKLFGPGSRMSGGTLDNVKLINISNRKDISIFDQTQPCKQLSGPSTNKLLHKRSDTHFSLFTRNATNDEYIYTEIEQSSDSAPAISVGAPFELMRAQQRWRCDAVVTFRDQFDSESGGIGRLGTNLDTYFVTSGRTRVGTDSAAMDSWLLGQNEWIEFDVPASFFKYGIGELNVGYFCTSGSSENIEITVGGDVVANIDARAGSDGNSVQIAYFQLENRGGANTITVRITNSTGTGGRNCYIIGLNLYDLRDDRSSLIPDGFKAWYRTDSSYVDTNGAGDYAIQDIDTGLFCGSYHGGETSTYCRMIVGDSKTDPTSLAANYFGVSKSIGVAQRTTITGGAGGGSYDTVSNLNYVVDGVEALRVSMTCDGNVSYIYTNLHPASDEFNRVLYPGDLALSGTENTQALALNNGDVVQLDDNSSLYTRHTFTLYDSSRNTFGGPHIWNRVGTYRKLYYGPIVNNLANCNGETFEFEYNREFGMGKY